MKKLAQMRQDYSLKSLDESDVLRNPLDQFKDWMDEALKSEIPEPNAMTLSTVSQEGFPSSRVVLLKGIEKDGFIFYTNYESKKAIEMKVNPNVCLNFCWLGLQRQIRIEGTVSRISKKQSLEYFQSRPPGSQIGAWGSPQSQVIENREVLEDRIKAVQAQFKGQKELPLPKFWGGYKVKPTRIEFWQGRQSRLHDRIQFRKNKRSWLIERLAP